MLSALPRLRPPNRRRAASRLACARRAATACRSRRLAREYDARRTYLLWVLADYRRFGLAEDVELPQQRLQALRSDSYVRMQAEVVSVAEGGSKARLVVYLKIDEGWHINANPASLDFLTPTTVTASIGAEALDLKPAYPPGKKIPTPLSEEAIAVYEGEVTITAPLPNRVREAGPDEVLSVSAQVQTCNDQGRCLTPAELKATFPLPVLGH